MRTRQASVPLRFGPPHGNGTKGARPLNSLWPARLRRSAARIGAETNFPLQILMATWQLALWEFISVSTWKRLTVHGVEETKQVHQDSDIEHASPHSMTACQPTFRGGKRSEHGSHLGAVKVDEAQESYQDASGEVLGWHSQHGGPKSFEEFVGTWRWLLGG